MDTHVRLKSSDFFGLGDYMINSVLKIITGILQVRGASDGTLIGNVSDAIKTVTIASGQFSTVTNTNISLSANTLTVILAANPARKYAYISSPNGSVNIQFGSSTGLTATTGILIAVKGLYQIFGGSLYTGPIYGFATALTTISVAEGT